MQAKIPVLAVTDPNTDIGKVIVDGRFGWWCESNDVNKFNNIIQKIMFDDFGVKGLNGKEYLTDNYTVNIAYKIIMNK